MFKNIFIVSIVFISAVACKGKKENIESSSSIKMEEQKAARAKTNAEISIKQGGYWKGRKYMDGAFINVSELMVPKEHTDHSWFIRYEGPGWESNKVGYRLYLDWRNAIDIFGKTTDELILNQVGQDGFDSYHEPQSWGMDILKVGKGLGIGSIGRNINGEVLHFNNVDSTHASVMNNSQSSSVNISYMGWKTAEDKIDLNSTLTIYPNKRYTKHTIDASEAISGICTGIVDHGVNYFTKNSSNGHWGYIATYGEQTLANDNLGMAIFYETSTVDGFEKGANDYLINFKPTIEQVSFYFLGAWEQEKDGIKTEKGFVDYLNALLEQLNTSNTL